MKSSIIILYYFILISILNQLAFSLFDIQKYGAVPYSDNLKDHFQNQKAFMDAVKAANQSQTSRIVRVPAKTFYSMPVRIQNVNNLKIQVLGRLAASKSVKFWPKDGSQRHWNFIQINNCSNIEISGGGRIDGRGYHWWVLCFLNDQKFLNHDDRPHLINMADCNNIKIHDLIFKNSGQFHLKMDRCHDAQIFNLNIKVNTTAQLNLLKKFSLQGSVVMFPFNTDGIDPSGGRMHIYNLTVQNFDDVVVPKPSHDDDCTRDMLVQNIQVKLGVGMSIGSVPPHQGGSCIRNITFRDVYMNRPFKGIYVKTNPGNSGWGNVTNIYYKNFTMDRPIWWAIYIGPQQMRQPGGAGPGCMLYPFDRKGTCSTQPRVTLKNITLEDITIYKSLLYPVTIRCNVSNPCSQINFINVKTDEWTIGQKQKGYVCQFATGKGLHNNPKIDCLEDSSSNQDLKNHKNLQVESQDISLDYEGYTQNSPLRTFHSDVGNNILQRKGSKWILQRVVHQLEEAVKQIPYTDSQQDQFEYDLKYIQKQFSIQDNELSPFTNLSQEMV